MKLLQNKNIIVTGASSGIGRQIAIDAALNGANVIMLARNGPKLQETMDAMTSGTHHIFPFDVTDFGSMNQLIDQIVDKAGPVSGFVHSAGMESTIPFRNMNAGYYEQLFKVNVIAAFELARIISKKKNVKPEGASFVFISSVMGVLGREGKVGYCASKAALTSSVKALSLELSSKKIRCNCVLPGMVQTEMVKNMFETLPATSVDQIIHEHPLGLGQPQDIANLVTFLLSDRSVWITGSEIIIDGGYSAR